MKNLFYFGIAVLTLSLSSCREQDEMVQFESTAPTQSNITPSTNDNGSEYTNFDSTDVDGDPAKPPKD